MTVSPWMANAVLNARKARIRSYNNKRFTMDGIEYKLVYEGGFFGFLTVYQRPEWKTRGKFTYAYTFSEDELYMDDVIGYIKSKIGGKNG